MGILDFLKGMKSPQINGAIKYYDLVPFWMSLTPHERQKCEEAGGMGISTGTSGGLTAGGCGSSRSKTAFLSTLAANMLSSKEYALMEKLLRLAETANSNPIDLHFCYNHWIELTYKQREDSHYLDLCIEYCKKDIELFPRIAKEMSEPFKPKQIKSNSPALKKHRERFDAMRKQQIEDGVDLRAFIPSFERLAIIYEKQNDIENAIKICELAIKHNARPSSKDGYEGRLEKLRAKAEKAHK